MLQYLTELYINVSVATKENPVLAGVVSLWGLSVITFICRNLPIRLWNIIYGQITTSMTFNNTGQEYNLLVFNKFNEWFMERKGASLSRSIAISRKSYFNDDKFGKIGAGYGFHVFIFNSRLFWYRKYKLENGGSNTSEVKEEVNISTFGRNPDCFVKLIKAFVPDKKENQLSIQEFDNGGWDHVCYSKKRSLSTVITSNGIQEKIVKILDEFFTNRKWYESRGLNYKQVYVLYGPPGTGKTSLIKALASHYNRDVCQLTLSMMSNNTFQKAIRKLPTASFCLIEDFDDSGAVSSRKGVMTIKKSPSDNGLIAPAEDNSTTKNIADMFEMLTLSTILNTLDGIADIDDVVIFMTTNCIDKIDPALLRKGRVDMSFYIGELKDSDIRRYIKMVFPEVKDLPRYTFQPIVGCDLAGLFVDNKHDHEAFIKSIPYYPDVLSIAQNFLNTQEHSTTVIYNECPSRVLRHDPIIETLIPR